MRALVSLRTNDIMRVIVTAMYIYACVPALMSPRMRVCASASTRVYVRAYLCLRVCVCARARAFPPACLPLLHGDYRSGAPAAFILFAFFAHRADLGITPSVVRCSGQMMCFLAFLLRLLALASQV